MARQVALAMVSGHIHKLQLPVWTCSDDPGLKIYQVRIVEICSLGDADAVGIMTGIAWRPYIGLKVFIVSFERGIAQYRGTAVATVAKGIRWWWFRSAGCSSAAIGGKVLQF